MAKRDKGRAAQRTPATGRREQGDHDVAWPSAAPPGASPWLLVALAAIGVLGIVLGVRLIASPDLGFHLATARWMLDNAAFPATDPFTYTVSDHAYIDLQWLFQMVVYGMHQLAGPAGITSATIALTLGFLATLALRTQRRNGGIGSGTLVLLMLFTLATLWEPRPHLLSWLYGSVLLLILEEYARGYRRWLPAIPLVMVLWVNSHALFILGLVILAIYIAGQLIAAKRRPGYFRPDKRLLAWAGVAVVACLINPYHIGAFLLPMTQFLDIQSGGAFTSPETGIAEFTSPFALGPYISDGRLVLLQPRLWYQLFTLLALAGVVWAWRKGRLVEWLLLLAFLYVFWKANKNFGYFVMASFPFAAGGLDQLLARLGRAVRTKSSSDESVGAPPGADAGRRAPPAPRVGPAAVIAACVLFVVLTLSGWLYDMAWSSTRPGIGFNREALPIDAARFVEQHGIEGRWLNTWKDGGFLAWATDQPVFIYSHGEVMGQQFYQRYVEAREPRGFGATLTRWEPTVALVRFRVTPFWLYELNRRGDWRMVHADTHTALFLHESVAPDVPAISAPVAGKDYPPFDRAKIAAVVDRAIQAGPAGFSQWLRGSDAFPLSSIRRASFYLHTNEIRACIGVSVAGLDEAGFLVPELMLSLGHALNHVGDHALADRCYEAFLRVDDDPRFRREIEMQRRSRR